MHLTLHFDGSCWPNPGGLAKYGYTLKGEGGSTLEAINGICGDGPLMSNNYAELYAMAEGLHRVSLINCFTEVTSVDVIGDSQLSINLLKGKYKPNPEKLYFPQCERAFEAATWLSFAGIKVNFKWVPREQNTEADRLSKL